MSKMKSFLGLTDANDKVFRLAGISEPTGITVEEDSEHIEEISEEIV